MAHGRAPKTDLGRKARYVSFRARNILYERLVAAAEDTERSVSEEIERRLERSFEDDDRLRVSGDQIRDLSDRNKKLDAHSRELALALIKVSVRRLYDKGGDPLPEGDDEMMAELEKRRDDEQAIVRKLEEAKARATTKNEDQKEPGE